MAASLKEKRTSITTIHSCHLQPSPSLFFLVGHSTFKNVLPVPAGTVLYVNFYFSSKGRICKQEMLKWWDCTLHSQDPYQQWGKMRDPCSNSHGKYLKRWNTKMLFLFWRCRWYTDKWIRKAEKWKCLLFLKTWIRKAEKWKFLFCFEDVCGVRTAGGQAGGGQGSGQEREEEVRVRQRRGRRRW